MEPPGRGNFALVAGSAHLGSTVTALTGMLTKPTLYIWLLAATTFAGAGIVAVLNIPALAGATGTGILVSLALSCLLAWPLSVKVAKEIE